VEGGQLSIVAGIDEAGYGPLLGPLVVTGVVFEVPDDRAEHCIWELLADSVTRRPRKRDLRLPILDSKKLYKPGAGLAGLERTALAMYASAKPLPKTFRELLHKVAPHTPDDMDGYPWYAGWDHALPLDADPGLITTQANAVRRDARAGSLRLSGVLAQPLLEGQYNRLVSSTRNKAIVLLGLTLRVVQRILDKAGGRPVRILVDRHGGRSHYGSHLMTSFDRFELEVLEESRQRSAYRLVRSPASHTIEFCTSGEEHHLPVALASIYSKYLRELFMRSLNRYWSNRVPSLRPTAGYYTDAKRFLADIAPAVRRQGIARNMLVRQR
jgi:ribonuclease HII